MKIEINDDIICVTSEHFDKNISKFVNLSDFLDKMSKFRKTAIGLLPPNTRVFEDCGSSILIGIEFQAQKREIQFTPIKRGMPYTYEVCLPAGIFLSTLGKQADHYLHISSHIFAVQRKISFEDEKIYKYPLPNIHRDGRICWGSDFTNKKLVKVSAAEGMLQNFFVSTFNTDLSPLEQINTQEKTIMAFFESIGKSFNPSILVEHSCHLGEQIRRLSF